MDELFEQSRNIFVGDQDEAKKFTKQIAFNVIPHIDSFLDDGSTKEEWKMVAETKKILDPKIKVQATCVRVPVFVGHSEALTIEFENELSAEEAQKLRSEEHTSELQSLMRISYAVFCLKKKKHNKHISNRQIQYTSKHS